MQHHKFEALDGLRGLFALSIALVHLTFMGHFFNFYPLRAGYMAVDFFFVLSGFVITHASMHKLTGAKSFGIFVLRRFGRVWPLHAAALICLVVFEAFKWYAELKSGITGGHPAFEAGGPTSVPTIFTNLLLIQSLGLHQDHTWNYPAWSISVEFFTYLIFAGLVFACAKRWLSPLLAVIALGCLLTLWAVSPNINLTNEYSLIRCMYGFFTGHLVYRLFKATPGKLAMSTLTEIFCIILILGFLTAAGFGKLSLLAPIIMVIPVWVFAYQQGAVSRALNTPVFQKLGYLSYSIYITHAILLLVITRGVKTLEKLTHRPFHFDQPVNIWDPYPVQLISFGNPWLMDLLAIAYLVAVVTFAAFATRFIEAPSRNYVNLLARKWQGQPSKV